MPANLQGLWTPHLWSPWRGNYTVNINLEENYWPAFVANMAEMAMPLDGFVQALAANGRYTAKNYYGIDKGWCSSHNSDIWAMTNPVGEKTRSRSGPTGILAVPGLSIRYGSAISSRKTRNTSRQWPTH